MKPNKENSMLLDIQYIKPNKQEGSPDFLYLIWKDLDTGEKFLKAVPEPKMDIYFSKPECRNFDYNKKCEKLSNLYKRTVKYKDIVFTIAEEMGDRGKAIVNDIMSTRNFKDLKKFHLYEYAFGTDHDVRSWYRANWIGKLDNNRVKKLNKGFLDIEADGINISGMVDPTTCPINAVTLIDASDKQVYTFLLDDTDEFIPSNLDNPNITYNKSEMKHEKFLIDGYRHKKEMITDIITNTDKFKQELHDMFDESYGVFNYNLYIYKDERKLLVHLFQLINKLKLDIIGIWNMSFDIPYIIERLNILGLDPKWVMCHPDFPVKECRFALDTKHFAIKEKSDFFHLSSYTLFYDQMELYASIRKSQQELRSYKLNYIARKEIHDEKLDYSEEGDLKKLPYIDYKKFVKYNIKDVFLQYGIERRTSDFDTLYVTSYKNATPYESVFKQTVKLRNVQLLFYNKQGLVTGNNINVFNKINESGDKVGYEGALVARPELNSNMGQVIYGRKSNNIFIYCIDMDMSAFYPNSVIGCNIDPSTLIFKMIINWDKFDQYNNSKKYKLHRIHSENDLDTIDNVADDCSKEIMDNFLTRNYMCTGHKWLNLPTSEEVYNRLKNKL